MRRRNPLEAIARARDDAMAERAKQACAMAPDAALEAAHAAGYAEAVADIRQMIETLHHGAVDVSAKDMFRTGGGGGVQGFAMGLNQVIGMLERCAHVGAAKRG